MLTLNMILTLLQRISKERCIVAMAYDFKPDRRVGYLIGNASLLQGHNEGVLVWWLHLMPAHHPYRSTFAVGLVHMHNQHTNQDFSHSVPDNRNRYLEPNNLSRHEKRVCVYVCACVRVFKHTLHCLQKHSTKT